MKAHIKRASDLRCRRTTSLQLDIIALFVRLSLHSQFAIDHPSGDASTTWDRNHHHKCSFVPLGDLLYLANRNLAFNYQFIGYSE